MLSNNQAGRMMNSVPELWRNSLAVVVVAAAAGAARILGTGLLSDLRSG